MSYNMSAGVKFLPIFINGMPVHNLIWWGVVWIKHIIKYRMGMNEN